MRIDFLGHFRAISSLTERKFPPKLGIGTWALFQTNGVWPDSPLDRSIQRRLLSFAIRSRSITFIDSAIAYGNGESDSLLAQFSYEESVRNGETVICTKVGRLASDVRKLHSNLDEFTHDLSEVISYGAFKSIAIHDLDLFNESLMREVCLTLVEKKRCGLIEKWGISLSRPFILPMLNFRPDFVQCNFNLLDDRLMASGLYDWAVTSEVDIWARTVFFSGAFLRRRTSVGETSTHVSQARSATVNSLTLALEESLELPIQEVAIRYICSFDRVNPLIGVSSLRMLKENVRLFDKGGFTPSELRLIREVSAPFVRKFDALSKESHFVL